MSAEYLEQLVEYTKDVCAFLEPTHGTVWDEGGKKNYKEWDAGTYEGYCIHYTASNEGVKPGKPFGRLPVMLKRFARNSGVPGVHLIAWDTRIPELEDLKQKYPVFEHLTCDVFCWGFDVAYYHAGSFNGFAAGVEIRNVGDVKKKTGKWYWLGGKSEYDGREPISVRDGLGYFEPYTAGQIDAVIKLGMWLNAVHPLAPSKVLGHVHATARRVDPGAHFPMHLVREAIFDKEAVSSNEWTEAFARDPSSCAGPVEYVESLEEPKEEIDDSDIARVGVETELEESDGFELEPGNVAGVKAALTKLGYWPHETMEPDFSSKENEAYLWTLKTFQRRWVIRNKASGKWVRVLKDDGIPGKKTIAKLKYMLRRLKLD